MPRAHAEPMAMPILGLLDGLINGCIFTAASPLKSVTCLVTTDPILMSGKRGLCLVEEFMHVFMLAPRVVLLSGSPRVPCSAD